MPPPSRPELVPQLTVACRMAASSGPVHHRYGAPCWVQLVTVVHWLRRGVWPSWVMHSWLSPVHVPTPSSTAKAGELPSVQSLHSDRISASLVGSKFTMSGTILRPWMPPASLISLTKSLMPLFCSLYSISPANPKIAARLDRLETGKTTLMVVAVTPALLVLARTGVAAPSVVVGLACLVEPVPTANTMATTTTTATTTETICTLPGRRRNRRHDRPTR